MNMDDPVIHRLIAWGKSRQDIRAIVLSSSRTNPTVQHLVDRLSDYDLDIIINTNARAWYEDRSWLEDMGKVMVGFVEPPDQEYGIEIFGCVILYEDGTKIDYTIMPIDIFRQVVAQPTLRGGWDDGHRVLLDKDGMARGMKEPTHQEFIPKPPAREAYQELIERFFTESTYVAKYLWRDELILVKHSLDQEMKGKYLCQMLSWRMEIDTNWSIRLGLMGRGIKQRLPSDLWEEFEATYVGAGLDENWTALHRTIALFRKVAIEVGGHLGFSYPHVLDRRVMRYLEWIKNLAH